jgi:hypothetical protein
MKKNSGERSHYGNSLRLFHGLDIVIVIALLVASVAFIPFMRAQSRDTVLVYKGADVIAKYPLDEDKVFYVDGLDGAMEIEIRDKQVRVHSSPCRNQICVNRGWISESYEQIICAQNLVFVLINSDPDKEEIDAVTYGE